VPTWRVVSRVRQLDQKLASKLDAVMLAQAKHDLAALVFNPYPSSAKRVRKSRRSFALSYGEWRLVYAVFPRRRVVEVWRFRRRHPDGYAAIPRRYNPLYATPRF
jgi:hypothetical protein